MDKLKNQQNCNPYFRFAQKYEMSPEEINGPRISYIQSVYLIVSGSGQFVYSDTTVELKPNVHIFLPSGKEHSIVSSKKNPIVFKCVFFEWNYLNRPGVNYRIDFLPELSSIINKDYIEKPIQAEILEYFLYENSNEWNYLFQQLLNDVNVYDISLFPSSLKIQGRFCLFLDYIFKTASQIPSTSDPRIVKILKQIETSSEDLSETNISQWAESLGLSRSYFHHIFKLHTGMTPNLYLNRFRIRRTFLDLSGTNMTITGIAEKHKFDSVHYYSKLFKKITGVTPGELRKQYRM
jgi:AraC family transcriptional regulator